MANRWDDDEAEYYRNYSKIKTTPIKLNNVAENSSDDEDDWIPINKAFQQRIVDHCEFVKFYVGIERVCHMDLVRLIKAADLRGNGFWMPMTLRIRRAIPTATPTL